MQLQEAKLKSIMKESMKETLIEERALLYDVMSEVIEDIALAKAIDEGKHSKKVSREAIFKILEGK